MKKNINLNGIQQYYLKCPEDLVLESCRYYINDIKKEKNNSIPGYGKLKNLELFENGCLFEYYTHPWPGDQHNECEHITIMYLENTDELIYLLTKSGAGFPIGESGDQMKKNINLNIELNKKTFEENYVKLGKEIDYSDIEEEINSPSQNNIIKLIKLKIDLYKRSKQIKERKLELLSKIIDGIEKEKQSKKTK